MIDNNVDRMSVVNILPFSLDRIVRSLEDQSVDESLQLFIINRINQDQLVTVSSLRTDKPGFFVSKVSSQITGNGVSLTLIINDGTLE
jgi:hypothetical protein